MTEGPNGQSELTALTAVADTGATTVWLECIATRVSGVGAGGACSQCYCQHVYFFIFVLVSACVPKSLVFRATALFLHLVVCLLVLISITIVLCWKRAQGMNESMNERINFILRG